MNLLNAIGNTPLISVNFDANNSATNLYAKLEYLNPGGSIKDRTDLYMIEEAEKKDILKPGGTLIDASSGNHGISLAMIGAVKGYKVIITTTAKCSLEKLNTMKAYGAEVIVCAPTKFIDDPENYHAIAVKLHKNTPNSFMPNQYFDPLNAEGVYHTLAPEIWNQTHGRITHFFAGAGTGGTISGVGKYLKEKNPDIKILAIDSDVSFRATKGNPKPYKIEGIGIDWDNNAVLDYSIVDEFLEVSDDNAFAMLKTLARRNGILVGPSSGAVAYAASQYASKLDKDAVAVMIFGDSGRAYLTKGFYD
ncbi:MAG TPA: cysteine synthase family protein [Candidatus Babeliales bacterium]|nr:cysteine synthase family protein [Candidatus Babeliales bacterium]